VSGYAEFLARKAQLSNAGGFEPTDLPDHLFDDQPPLDQRTAHLARALFADLDYVLGVDPNTLAAFCVRVLDEYDGRTYRWPL
jgi:hypothetical protein